jgi:nicotinate-nucleotide adenylyltransferase
MTEARSDIEMFSGLRRVGVFGGSFDPVHNGHLAIAQALTPLFALDAFVMLPAFHAPHKRRAAPTSSIDRFAMISLATADSPKIFVSKFEIEQPERPYTVQTLGRLRDLLPETRIFFVMGADSWTDITTWHRWEEVLTLSDHIVVTRPGNGLPLDHIGAELGQRIVDIRGRTNGEFAVENTERIYITDAVCADISATRIRLAIRENKTGWKDEVPDQVANYIEKYQIYK